MYKINISEYTITVTDPIVANRILEDIRKRLEASASVEIDFSKVEIMTTGCSAQIFGTLYTELGSVDFSTRLIIKNADEDLRIVIRHGILNSKGNTAT